MHTQSLHLSAFPRRPTPTIDPPSGYLESCKTIMTATRHFASELSNTQRFPDLYILGDPKVSVVAFASRTLNVYEIGDRMGKKGWGLNALKGPAGLHLACTVS
jgi:sphinganine-1-phosphate aldolase